MRPTKILVITFMAALLFMLAFLITLDVTDCWLQWKGRVNWKYGFRGCLVEWDGEFVKEPERYEERDY